VCPRGQPHRYHPGSINQPPSLCAVAYPEASAECISPVSAALPRFPIRPGAIRPVSPTRRPSVKRNPFTLPVKADRRMPDVRRRLARLSKPELIEQLLELQNAYAVV
jgi:hypothetical protein